MNELFFAMLWAMEPMAFRHLQSHMRNAPDLRAQFISGTSLVNPQAPMAQKPIAMPVVFAGAVDDAERIGLPIRRAGNVAVITMSGPMFKSIGWYSSYYAGSLETAAALNVAARDEEIEKVLWRIDSPGGSVAGMHELLDAAKALKAAGKELIVQVEGTLASAAYYAACHADKIYAQRMDMIGSIGTRMQLWDSSGYYADMKIEAVVIDTGEFKSAGAEGTVITEAHRAEFQRVVDGFFADFKTQVTSGRGFNDKQFAAISDGRMQFAADAIGLGLIDGIQTFDKTLAGLFSQSSSNRSTASARNRLRLATSS